MFEKHICANCGSKIKPTQEKKRSTLTLLFLLLMGVIPGLIYYAVTGKGGKVSCPKCNSSDIVPLGSPRGKKLLKEYAS